MNEGEVRVLLARAHELHGVEGLACEALQLRFEVRCRGIQGDGNVARPFRATHLLDLQYHLALLFHLLVRPLLSLFVFVFFFVFAFSAVRGIFSQIYNENQKERTKKKGRLVVSRVVGPSVVSLRLGSRWLSPILGRGGWSWLAALIRRWWSLKSCHASPTPSRPGVGGRL